MEKIMEQEGKVVGQQQQQRASVPAFGEWDEMKAAGVLPDYSLDFSKIRAVRMQQRKEQLPSVWSSAGSAQEVALAAAGDELHHHHKRQPPASDDRRHHHRRQHSDGTDLRRPLRAPDRAAAATPKGRSKVKGYLFGCMSGW